MAAVLVQVCVDDRLNHELLRVQVRQRLERSGLLPARILILNEIGGNLGSNFRNTVELLLGQNEPVVFAAVLHHDECRAAQAGRRVPLDETLAQMSTYLTQLGVRCPVVGGTVRTAHNHLLWSDEPAPIYRPFTFGSW